MKHLHTGFHRAIMMESSIFSAELHRNGKNNIVCESRVVSRYTRISRCSKFTNHVCIASTWFVRDTLEPLWMKSGGARLSPYSLPEIASASTGCPRENKGSSQSWGKVSTYRPSWQCTSTARDRTTKKEKERKNYTGSTEW